MDEMINPRMAVVLVLLWFPVFGYAQKPPTPGALATAVAAGDSRRMEILISQGADPNERDASGQTPLMYAVSMGHYKLADRLLDIPVDPNRPGVGNLTPLIQAVLSSREDLVVLLISRGADPNLIVDAPEPVSPLSSALDRGEFVIAHRLISAGANPLRLANPESPGPNPLMLPRLKVPLTGRLWRDWAALGDNADSPNWDAETDGKAAFALHRAARDGAWRAVLLLLDDGIHPDQKDDRLVTPLMTAAWHGRGSVVSLLLRGGADPNLTDADGRTALSYAAGAGHENITALLLDVTNVYTGADLRSSPLYAALPIGSRNTFELLLQGGLQPIGRDSEGITLLMMAAWMSDTYLVRRLLPLEPQGQAIRDDARRSALEWCAAAFERDRTTGREVGNPLRGQRNYPVARILARRTKDPLDFRPITSPDIDKDIIQAWSPGWNSVVAKDWRSLTPSPVPLVPGDGDLTLYRIFRDEEPLEPSAPNPMES